MITPVSVAAQGVDDCPAGAIKRPPLTTTDFPTMLAAYSASFRGIYGRDPTNQRGSGINDGPYWVSVSDHYGAFGDGICRAGWNAYWEAKLECQCDSVDPRLADRPARFQPAAGPSQPPPPVVLPPAPPSQEGVLLAIRELRDRMEKDHLEQNVAHAAIQQNITDHRAETKPALDALKDVLVFAGKYILPAAAVLVTCVKTDKCQ